MHCMRMYCTVQYSTAHPHTVHDTHASQVKSRYVEAVQDVVSVMAAYCDCKACVSCTV